MPFRKAPDAPPEKFNPEHHDMYKMPDKGADDAKKGCCAGKSPHDKMDKPTNPDPCQIKRSHTDVLAILLLIACWVIMTGLGIDACETGNAQALFSPADYNGKICGVDSPNKDLKYGYVINYNLDMVCLESCPKETVWDITDNAYDNMICMDDLVSDSYKESSYLNQISDADALFDSGGGLCNFEIETFHLLYYCVFDPSATFPNTSAAGDYAGEKVSSIMGDADTSAGALMDFVADLITCKNYIFGFGFAVALFVAFAYTWLMSLGAVYPLVWGSIIMCFCFILSLGVYIYETALLWSEPEYESYEITGMKALGGIFMCLAALFACLILCICSKINLCCGLVEVAGDAVRQMPVTIFFPIIQVTALVLFMLPWTFYMVYVNAQGEYDTTYKNTTGVIVETETWEFSDSDDTAQIFFMFIFFWTSQFIIALGQLVMALTFAKWYFTKDPESEVDSAKRGCCCRFWCPHEHAHRGNGLFFQAWASGIWYHVGTAAAGSLIIAIVKTIRYIIAKIQYHAKKNLTGSVKKVAEIVLCCIQCCLYCIEKCMKFINKHAYIITAVKGKRFCAAACDAFWLICRNIRLIGALTLVQEFVVIIGKILIVCATGALSYYYMANEIEEGEVSSLVGPTLFVMILAYFMADMFCSVYSMAIDTMMHCFMADKEMYDPPHAGDPSCPHLSNLASFVSKHAHAPEEGESEMTKQEPNQE